MTSAVAAGFGRDAVLHEAQLLLSAALRFQGLFHGFGDLIGVEHGPTVHIPGSSADGLDEALRQEALLVISRMATRATSGIEALPEQVDAHQHIEHPGPQIPNTSTRSTVSMSEWR